MEQGEVVEPGVPHGRPGLGLLYEDEKILAPGAEVGLPVLPAMQHESDRLLVEAYGAVEVRDCQLDGSEPRVRGQPGGLRCELDHPDTSAGLRGFGIGVSRGSICSRRCSNAGGSERRSPSDSFGSSESKPGPIVAISKRTPLGSREEGGGE